MKKIILSSIVTLISVISFAQVKIGANATSVNANSILELESSTKGILFPRVALTGTANVAPLAAHVQGMTVYNTATTADVTPGIYTNSGSAWVKLGASTPAFQDISGSVQTFTTAGTISDNTYLVFYNTTGNNTIATPTPVAGKTFWVRNISTGQCTCAGVNVLAGKGRCFVSDGTSWFLMTP
jgi:hypothetical protein